MQSIIQMTNTSPHRLRKQKLYNRVCSDPKCSTSHRGYPGKGIMEGDCTHNPEDWNNKSIK